MCGIAGFYKTSTNQLNPYKDNEVASIQFSRGPDSAGYKEFLDSQVKLYHQRLSIIDLSEYGKQPITTLCQKCGKDVWLVYNGELYNYKNLKEDLIKLGHTFTTHTDSEVIIHAYTQYGLDALVKFNGIFSLALFDGRSNINSETIKTNDLIIVRDPLGVKPLYYTSNESYFGFASELKTLLLDQKLRRDIDVTAINDYLTYLWCPAPKTPLKVVKKLEPGHFLIVRDGHVVNKKRYYEIPIKAKSELSQLKSDELIDLTRHKVQQAVTRQMVADVPIGAFLSGGLDSSAIVACMKKAEPNINIDCFTIKSKAEKEDGFVDDLMYAKQVARHLGVNLHEVEINEDFYKLLPEMVYHLDEPQADPAPINAYLIAEQAKQGYKVLMSGAGGDDIFTGYRRHRAIELEKYWQDLPKPILQAISKVTGKLNQKNPLTRRISKLFKNAGQDENVRLTSYFDWASDDLRQKLLVKPIAANENSLLKSLKNIQDENISRLNQMLYLECKHFLTDHNLNYTDKMTMAHHIETRVPLLDLDLVEFAFTIPNNLKQKGAVGKYIFKKAMEPYLPHDVIYRPKTGFGSPLRAWIDKGMKKVLDDLLGEQSIKARGIFDYEAVKQLREENRLGLIDGSYIILALLNIELWCRTFVDPEKPTIFNLFN